MGGDAVILGTGGVCENPVRFSSNDGPMETVEYIWVLIIGLLDFDCRNALPWHKLLKF